MADGKEVSKPGDEVAPGTPQSGEGLCPKCSGKGATKGATDGAPCPECGGTGRVTVLVGDA